MSFLSFIKWTKLQASSLNHADKPFQKPPSMSLWSVDINRYQPHVPPINLHGNHSSIRTYCYSDRLYSTFLYPQHNKPATRKSADKRNFKMRFKTHWNWYDIQWYRAGAVHETISLDQHELKNLLNERHFSFMISSAFSLLPPERFS